MKKHLLPRLAALLLMLAVSVSLSAQTVIDMHTGRVSGKTRDDYNYKAREDWQLREDSIAYNDCITRAFNFLYEDSLQTAQDLFERALKLRPDAPGNSVVRANIGRIYMARHQWKDAVSLFTRILEEVPRFDDAREDRATCYYELSQYDRALADYRYLAMTHPDDSHYRLFCAIMLSYSGRKYEAIDELDALVEADDTNSSLYLTRAGVYLDLGNKGYARRDLDRAVSLGVPKDDIQDLYEQLK